MLVIDKATEPSNDNGYEFAALWLLGDKFE
jgi:hypothetical protein